MFIIVAFTAKGSAEDLVKKELQAVAEGVAASVFQPSSRSNSDISTEINASGYEGNKDIDVLPSDIKMQHKAKLEVWNIRYVCSPSVCSLSSVICICPLSMNLSSCVSYFFS